jgi:hypothetical protein
MAKTVAVTTTAKRIANLVFAILSNLKQITY